MTNEERVEAFRELIQKVSRTVSRNYPDVDEEDVSQELYLLVLSRRSIPTPEEDAEKASTVIWYAGKAAARRQRAQHLHISIQYAYTRNDVRNILEDLFAQRDGWLSGWTPEDALSEDGTDSMTVRSDIAWAYDFLNEAQKTAIFRRYGLLEFTSPKSPEGKQLLRALDKLVTILNTYSRGHREGPGKRHAVSNATARAIIEDQT